MHVTMFIFIVGEETSKNLDNAQGETGKKLNRCWPHLELWHSLQIHYTLLKADPLQRVPEGVNSGFSSAAHAHSWLPIWTSWIPPGFTEGIRVSEQCRLKLDTVRPNVPHVKFSAYVLLIIYLLNCAEIAANWLLLGLCDGRLGFSLSTKSYST